MRIENGISVGDTWDFTVSLGILFFRRGKKKEPEASMGKYYDLASLDSKMACSLYTLHVLHSLYFFIFLNYFIIECSVKKRAFRSRKY